LGTVLALYADGFSVVLAGRRREMLKETAALARTLTAALGLAQLVVRRHRRQSHNDRLIAECTDEPQQAGRA